MRIKSNMAVWLLPRLPIMLMLLVFALQCEDPGDIEPDNLITNPSFEMAGQPSIDGWNYLVIVGNEYYDFVKDTPPGGGSWSVQVRSGRALEPGFVETMLSGINDEGIFELSAWMKSAREIFGGSISLTQTRYGNVVHSKYLYLAPTEWTRVSFRDTLDIDTSDTLHIKLFADSADLPMLLFDLVSFKKIQ